MQFSISQPLCISVSLLLASFASAQCPLSVPDVLNNTNWAFHFESPDVTGAPTSFAVPEGGAAAIGTFTINRNATGRGSGNLNLTGTMSVNAANSISRLTSITGGVQYQCDGNGLLRGGTLQFADGRNGTLWQFVFSTGGYAEMFMVNELYVDNISLSKVLRGVAVKITNQAACPANPNLVLDASAAPFGWSLQTQTATNDLISGLSSNFVFSGTTANGYLNFRAAATDGAVAGTVTANHSSGTFAAAGNGVVLLADTFGRYQVYPGCTGGVMSFKVGLLQVQYEFVFASGDFSQIYLLGAATGTGFVGSGPKTDILNGTLRRF